MRTPLLVLAVLLAAHDGWAGERAPLRPFEARQWTVAESPLDRHVAAGLTKRGLGLAPPCSDETFARRLYLDVLGTLPTADEVMKFTRDRSEGKRAALVDALLERDEHAEYWALHWCDVLRVKAEFPINLWPNAVQAYHRWVRDAVRSNLSYDRFARALLTSSGSNFRTPAVNFYRAVQDRKPPGLASAAALTFMGARVSRWTPERREALEAFFASVAFKRTAEWKEEIVHVDPAPRQALRAILPDGKRVIIPPERDPRTVFADWLCTPRNRWFAAAAVNRTWSWAFGRGLVHEADDLRRDNPAVHPEAMAYLEKELVLSGWDLQHVLRLILNSRTYQQSPIPAVSRSDAEELFACYPVRRLDAEVLIDALDRIGGTGETYTSAIPEPFTFIPEERRSIELADGSITSPFLEMFGRPARDSGLLSERNNNPSAAQVLHLLNSTEVKRKVERSPLVRSLVKRSRGKRRDFVRLLYLSILSREPLDSEVETVKAYFTAPGANTAEATVDLVWALINSKEFLCRH